MGLFDFGKNKKPKVTVTATIEMAGYENGKRVKLKSGGGKIEKPKSMEYYQTIKREIKPLENAMVGFAVSAKNSRRVDDRIAALNGVIKTYYTLKAKCESLGYDYKKYFSDMWKPSYVEKFEKEFAELRRNRSTLAAQEALHDRESVNLDGRVLAILRSAPSILQTDVYKYFDESVRGDVQSILYFMEKNGTIKKEKSGRTYRIYYHGKK